MPTKSHAATEGDAPVRENTGQAIATVERAVEVLMHFTETPSPTLGVTEIAEALGMSKRPCTGSWPRCACAVSSNWTW